MSNDESEIFRRLVEHANEQTDGHLTIMKFTTNWRVGFGTPLHRYEIQLMAEGKTFSEAAKAALEDIG
jgi:hypothetical protein